MTTDHRRYDRVYIGLGSNRGDRAQQLAQAIDWLAIHPEISVTAVTDFLETEPWGVIDQAPFLNAVVRVATDLEPLPLLGELKRAEAELGRRPSPVRYGPREIDLDILLFQERIVTEPALCVPHARLIERDFVLCQLLALDPSLEHPVSGLPLRELFEKLKSISGISITESEFTVTREQRKKTRAK